QKGGRRETDIERERERGREGERVEGGEVDEHSEKVCVYVCVCVCVCVYVCVYEGDVLTSLWMRWKLLPWKLKACSNSTLSSTVHSSGKGVKLARSASDFSTS